MDQQHPQPAIKCGVIEATQRGENIVLVYKGKRQDVAVEIPASRFERWVLIQLRKEVFV